MGKKSRSKREKLLKAKSHAFRKGKKNSFARLGTLLNNFFPMTEGSENYGIRHLLEKRLKSRNCSGLDAIPKFIDLSKDEKFCDKEVIDLTETSTKSDGILSVSQKVTKNVECDASEPTIIEISEEETNANSESEEVCVIGTYTKPSQAFPPLKEPLLDEGLRELVLCKEKTVRNWLMFRSNDCVSKVKKCKKRLPRQERDENLRLGLPLQVRWKKNVDNIGSNVYVHSPLSLPSSGLRPIIIDGNNVAYMHSGYHFCCKRLEICINYFKEKGHRVIAFVPQYRMSSKKNDDPELLQKLEREGYVVLTPSKEIDGRKVVPYDDRYIVQTAVLKGGIIISRDNYKDLLSENPAWADTIKYRTLAFTWVDDVLMFPEDPLGEFGPKLEEFLRFR